MLSSIWNATHFGGGGRHQSLVQYLPLSPPPLVNRISFNLIRFKRPESDDVRFMSLKCNPSLMRKMLIHKKSGVFSWGLKYRELDPNIDSLVMCVKTCGVMLAMTMAVFLIPNPYFCSRRHLSLLPPITSTTISTKVEKIDDVPSTILLVRLASFTYRAFLTFHIVEEIAYIVGRFFCICCGADLVPPPESRRATLLQLQVALLSSEEASALKKNLGDIAKGSTPDDMFCCLTETRRDLLNHQQHCISAFSNWKVERSVEEGMERMVCEKRRTKEMQAQRDPSSIHTNNGYIVVTIAVVAKGDHWIPIIRPTSMHKDLEYALVQLGHIPPSQMRGIMVHWSPDSRNKALSDKELAQYYPHLKRAH